MKKETLGLENGTGSLGEDRWPMMSVPRKDPCTLPTPRHSVERGGNNGKATPFPGAAQGGASLGERTPCLAGLVNRNQCLQRAHHRFTASEQHLRCRRPLPLVVKSQEDMALKASRPEQALL